MSDDRLTEQARMLERLLPRLMRQLFALDFDDPTVELTVAQLRVCATLTEGASTISALAKHLGNSVSAATQIADRLEALGIVERTPAPGDRRKRILRLTTRGADILRRRRQGRVRQARRVLRELTPSRRAAALRALDALLTASALAAATSPPVRQVDDVI
jgi:DNA-binding MarR family transcriptional regulator